MQKTSSKIDETVETLSRNLCYFKCFEKNKTESSPWPRDLCLKLDKLHINVGQFVAKCDKIAVKCDKIAVKCDKIAAKCDKISDQFDKIAAKCDKIADQCDIIVA